MTEFLGRAFGVTVIGDSNSIIYNNLLLRSPQRPEIVFAFNTHYIPESKLSEFVSADGSLAAEIREALIRGCVVSHHNSRPINRNPDFDAILIEMAASGDRRSDLTPLVFETGHRDVAKILFRLGPGADFLMTPGRHGPSPVDAVGSTTLVPMSLVEELLEPSLTAFCRGIEHLLASGLERIYCIGFRPPALDDDEFERRWQIRSRAHLRYKVSLLLNERFAAACERLGIVFVDPWPLLTRDGVFDEAFELDLVHINRAGALKIASEIVEHYVASTPVLDSR